MPSFEKIGALSADFRMELIAMRKIQAMMVITIFLISSVGLGVVTTTVKATNGPSILAPPCSLFGTCDDGTTYPWEDSDPETPWGIERVYNGNYYGDQYTTAVQVAILDTGIDLDHPDLQPNIHWAVDANGGNSVDDKNGHGTHVAGTIGAIRDNNGVVGMYANVQLYAIKVLGNGGSGSWDDLITGLDLAMRGPDGIVGTEDDADVVSMSLGASSDPGDAVHNKIIELYNAGITLVAAAGNDGDGDPSTTELGYPAAYPEVIAVASTDKDDGISSFSNTGAYIDFAAPGRSVYSTYKNGGYDTLSGTSMACPHVSGMVALFLAMGGARDPSAAYDWLKSNALDLGPAGHDTGYGWGLIQSP